MHITPILTPHITPVLTLASDEKPFMALHLPSAASPNDTPNWHGRMNANMGADVHRMHQAEARESEEQPTANISNSQPENESRRHIEFDSHDNLKGQLAPRTPRAMRNVFGAHRSSKC